MVMSRRTAIVVATVATGAALVLGAGTGWLMRGGEVTRLEARLDALEAGMDVADPSDGTEPTAVVLPDDQTPAAETASTDAPASPCR